MTKVGLISDTHGYIDEKVLSYLEPCTHIWHAGDIGKPSVFFQLKSLNKVFHPVYGNIDSHDIRNLAPKSQFFIVEDLKVVITHIGGSPGNYVSDAKKLIIDNKPDLFVCGHSHILKVIRDSSYNLVYINPGAIGKTGFHKIRTMIRFDINRKQLCNMEVIELKR